MECRLCGRKEQGGKRLADISSVGQPSGPHMLYFCVDIQLDVDEAASTMMCSKCCSKLISFYKFKCRAIKAFTYIQYIQNAIQTKTKMHFDNNYKIEETVEQDLSVEDDLHEDSGDMEVKSELGELVKVKQESEDSPEPAADSDDQLLSSLQLIGPPDQQTEGSTLKRKRGRPKSTKAGDKKSHSKEGVCDLCGKNVRNLSEHLRRHLPAADRPRLPCGKCHKTFATHGSRYRHDRTKHLGIRPHCDICKKDVSDKRAHDLVVHNPEAMRYPCVVCGHRFPLPSSRDAHMFTHTKLRPYACAECGDSFRTKGLMGNHVRSVHNKEKTHLCQYCSKGFFKKHHLILHLRIHTDERPLACPECDKRFRNLSGLHMHVRRHRGERTHPCALCSSSFYNAGALRIHMVSHTKEKRYQCKYCGVKFGRSDHRNRHERTAHAHDTTAQAPPSPPPPAPAPDTSAASHHDNI